MYQSNRSSGLFEGRIAKGQLEQFLPLNSLYPLQVLQLLMEGSQTQPYDQRIDEAYLTCICQLLRLWDDDEIDLSPNNSPSSLTSSLLDLLTSLSSRLLTAEKPATLLDCYTRIAIGELISQSATKLPLNER